MFHGPFGPNILMAMPKDKCVDLLFQAFQGLLMVIPHPEIFFDGIIFTGRNINRMISSITQTLSNQTSITCICFDTFSLLCEHRSRCQNHTFDSGIGKLMVQRVAKAAGLITAFNIIIIVKTELHFQRFDEVNDLFVVRSNLYFSENTVFRSNCGLHRA